LFRKKREEKAKSIWELIAKLRESFGDRAWQPIIEAEIMADEISRRVVNELLARMPKPERIKPMIKPPFAKTLSKPYDFIREEDKSGSLIEFSLTTTSTNFRVHIVRDTDILSPGWTFTELMNKSASTAWLTAVQKPDTGEYWLQVAGLDFEKKLIIGVEPLEEIRFYNISWAYILIER